MAAAVPGLRQDPSFLRAATSACPSYGSPVRSQEGRARPGWRMMGASPPDPASRASGLKLPPPLLSDLPGWRKPAGPHPPELRSAKRC